MLLLMITWCNKPLGACACQRADSFESTYQKTVVNDFPTSIRIICGRHGESPNHADFLDWNYYYKSVAPQIPHGIGWALMQSSETSSPCRIKLAYSVQLHYNGTGTVGNVAAIKLLTFRLNCCNSEEVSILCYYSKITFSYINSLN